MTDTYKAFEDRGRYNEYQEYLTRIYGGDNSDSHRRLLRNMRAAMKDELTPRQLQMIAMYYGENIKIPEIARRLGVDNSTVSRTLKRGRRRLARCLKYGAAELLSHEDE